MESAMATRWPGVETEHHVRISWRFAFVPAGTVTQPSSNTVYLDVGGGYGPGVIDHHQGDTVRASAARLLANRPDFAYEHLIASLPFVHHGATDVEWRPTIVLHRSPDFDAMVSAYLVMRLVEQGVSPSERWEWLVTYADRVDQGIEQLTSTDRPVLYPLILVVSSLDIRCDPNKALLTDLARAWCDEHKRSLPSDHDELRLCAGLYLVTMADTHRQAMAKSSTAAQLGELGEGHLISALHDLLREDSRRYAQAKDDGRVERLDPIHVPITGSKEPGSVSGGLIKDINHGLSCHKLHMRADNPPMPLTVIKREVRGVQSAWGWIIALDPDFKIEGAQPHLKGLGASLEMAEQRLAGRRTDSTTPERRGATRYQEFPGIADPWYDGRGHEHTIVDSPFTGTVLTAEEVFAILRQPFWQPELGCFAASEAESDADGVVAFFERTLPEPAGPIEQPRLDQVEALCAQIGSRTDSARSSFLLVVMNVKSAWGEGFRESIAGTITGSTKPPMRWQGHQTHIGPSGAVVFLEDGSSQRMAADLLGHLQAAARPALRLMAALAHTDDVIQQLPKKGSDSIPNWSLRTRHVRSVAEYWTERGRSSVPEASLIMDGLQANLGLLDRIEGVGQLLEHLDDSKRRIQTARLNRLVLMLGLFGVIQTSERLLCDGWLLGVVVGALVFCALLLTTWFCRRVARNPWLRTRFFDDVEFHDDAPASTGQPGAVGRSKSQPE
jgi:hypothetical protein